tara:strand:+ start:238 stop:543 length:306 start_codon:yes stop_codon:yes gene_type:complete
VIIDFEKERRKRFYPEEEGFHEYVQIIIPLRKDGEERRYFGTDVSFITNSDFFHEQMMDHKIKLKFLSNMHKYFEGFEIELKNNTGVDLVMNHIDGIEEEE